MKFIVCIIMAALVLSSLTYFGCQKVVNSRALAGGYFIKEGEVWFDTGLHGLGTRESWPITEADAATFTCVNNDLAKDKKQVYYRGKVVKNADGSSFVLLKDNWWKDQNQVYLNATAVSQEPDYFRFITTLDGLAFAKDSRQVYCNAKVVSNADAATFKYVKKDYFVDKNTAYYRSVVIKGADGPSFRVIDEIYTKDHQHVWKKGSLINGADPDSFQPMQHPYSRDKQHVFFNNHILSKRPDDFKVMGKGPMFHYAIDNEFLYYGGTKLPEGEWDTFQVMGHGYALDVRQVYRGKEVLPYANPDFFEVLNEKYTRDDERVYYEDRLIEGADPSTFMVHGSISNEAKDKNGYYKSGHPSKTDYGW